LPPDYFVQPIISGHSLSTTPGRVDPTDKCRLLSTIFKPLLAVRPASGHRLITEDGWRAAFPSGNGMAKAPTTFKRNGPMSQTVTEQQFVTPSTKTNQP
jgi:hypothetical protein